MNPRIEFRFTQCMDSKFLRRAKDNIRDLCAQVEDGERRGTDHQGESYHTGSAPQSRLPKPSTQQTGGPCVLMLY